DRLHEEARRGNEEEEPEDEEEMVRAGQDVLDAEPRVAADDVPAARPYRDRERRRPRAEHRLHPRPVEPLDREERADLRGGEVGDRDALAGEAFIAAVDGPAERHAVGLVDRIRAADPPAARGEDGLDVRARETERGRLPPHLEHAGPRLAERERRG